MKAVENLRINGERLWDSLMALAKIGSTPKGGVCRVALTDLDRRGRDLVIQWLRDAGLAVTVDRIGNIFGRRPGRNPSAAPVLAGSHIDTQPSGGKFDGNYGVLAALEVVRTLNEHKVETDAPIEVAIWTNEEGTRFAPVMMGSGAFAGVFSLEYCLGRTDLEGKSVGDELQRIGYAGPAAVGGRPIGAYFEAHIEQGPVLEDTGDTIGVVTGALGLRWFDIVLQGQDAHAGSTPMHLRRDALLAASRMVEEVNRIALAFQPDGRGTVGFMQVRPNSRNVVPGEARFSVDLRHAEDAALEKMERLLREACARVSNESRIDCSIERVAHSVPAHFHAACVAAVRDAATELDLRHRDITSGATHDACYMARIAPAGMIFVPCEGGISHNEIENAKPEDLAAGCDVLLRAVLGRATNVTLPAPGKSM